VPIRDVAGKLKQVPADDGMVRSALAIGTSFGCKEPGGQGGGP